MAVRFTMGKFPADAQLRDTSGLPWGCVVQPFALEDSTTAMSPDLLPRADDVARCEMCYAYVNAYCTLERYSWRCALCDAVNSFADANYQRYGNRARVAELPEMASSIVELDVATEDDQEDLGKSPNNIFNRPVYVAVVDLSGSEDFLELVKSALMAALEALNPAALFGLVTFGHKVGLYDVQGPVPVVKYVAIPTDKDAPLPVDLEDVLPLQAFLAPVEDNKENIAAALEALRPTSQLDMAVPSGVPGGADTSAGGEALGSSERGFGAALDAVLRYLGAEEGGGFVSARLFAFLSGLPDLGVGQLDASRYRELVAAGKGGDTEGGILVEQTEFYKEMAAAAVQAGVCVDLFAVTGDYLDLASLKFLSVESGGGMFLYPSVEEATLPQDIYRMLSRPHALGGVLRLRCSPEFRPIRAYGHFFPDAQYENLYHIISCDSFDTYAFDFEFNSSQGFNRGADTPPTLQMAFQYTAMIPLEGKSAPDEGGGLATTPPTPTANGNRKEGPHGERYVLRRRLVVRSIQIPVARSPQEVYESADTEAILALLTHKVIRATLEEGVREGRLLLQDWLVILTANYNNHYKLAQFGQPSSVPQMDVAFVRCPALQPLPRLVFSLLRSPLLRVADEGVHPDRRIYLQCLYSSLDPSCLLRAIYPVLSSYTTPDRSAYPRHSLSRAALITSGSPIFLLDAFTTLIVYYSHAARADLPFPPPHNSMLRNTINKLKQDRTITPRLLMIRGGVDNTEPFERLLIEEQDVDGQAGAHGVGFVSFLEQIANDVREYMK